LPFKETRVVSGRFLLAVIFLHGTLSHAGCGLSPASADLSVRATLLYSYPTKAKYNASWLGHCDLSTTCYISIQLDHPGHHCTHRHGFVPLVNIMAYYFPRLKLEAGVNLYLWRHS